MSNYILTIDQGTTTSRALIFTLPGVKVLAQSQKAFKQIFPQDGWVEHDPKEIWLSTLQVCQDVIHSAQLTGHDIAAIGLANQRETIIIWDKNTGEAIYPAIVWQDRRTADICERLKANDSDFTKLVQDKTGLLLDPYFSASKIMWILENIAGASAKAQRGELALGTVDSFLIWNLTGGKYHVTDATNASRTLLYNIDSQTWDDDLLNYFNIPKRMLPQVLDCSDFFGETDPTLFGRKIPILGVAGDQHAAMVGQMAFKPGMAKSTYGTGGFVMLNTGERRIRSEHRLLSTLAYRIKGQTTYALEGSIFAAGSTIQWLRDSLELIQTAQQSETLAGEVTSTAGVYLVPAFTGLGAPHWNPYARGAILGLTRDTQINHIVRAALEAVGYQTKDLILAMHKDSQLPLNSLRVDGGMTVNHWMLQFLTDILNISVTRPKLIEITALGVALLAALNLGIYSSLEDISKEWQLDLAFEPRMPAKEREHLCQGWNEAVSQVLTGKN